MPVVELSTPGPCQPAIQVALYGCFKIGGLCPGQREGAGPLGMRLLRDMSFNMDGDRWFVASSLRAQLNQGSQQVPVGLAELRYDMNQDVDVEAVE